MCNWYKETFDYSSYIINYPNHKYDWYNLKNHCDMDTMFAVWEISPRMMVVKIENLICRSNSSSKISNLNCESSLLALVVDGCRT